jgi:hypothetical protein
MGMPIFHAIAVGRTAYTKHRFQLRTLEILDSFGIGERVWKEANHMIGMAS